MDTSKMEWQERERKFYSNPRIFFVLSIMLYFFWAFAIPFTKLGYAAFHIGETDVPEILIWGGIRLFFGGLVVLIMGAFKGHKVLPSSKTGWHNLLKLSLIMSVLQYTFLNIGTAKSPGVVASILISSGSFIGVLLSGVVFKEDKLTIRKLLGCTLGLIAVIILNIQNLHTVITVSVSGSLFIIAAQFSGNLGAIYLKIISQGKNAVYIGAAQTCIGGAVLILLGFLFGGCLPAENLSDALFPVIGVICVTAFGLMISNQLYKYNDISKVVIFSLLQPVFGTVISAVMLGEPLASLPLLLSLGLNSAGVALATIEKNEDAQKTV